MSDSQRQSQPLRLLQARSKHIWETLRDLIAPARCMNCLREGTWLCRECAVHVPDFPALRYEKEAPLSGIVSAGAYGSEYLRRGIGWLKFRGVQELAPVLASLLVPKLSAIAPVAQLQKEAVLIPIPLHKRRLRQRGFNQSLEIARALAAQTSIPVTDILTRQRATLAQAMLPHEMRAENVEDAFVVSGPLPNKKYLLILDDVSTTGSTLLAAATVLRENHRGIIWGVTVARG